MKEKIYTLKQRVENEIEEAIVQIENGDIGITDKIVMFMVVLTGTITGFLTVESIVGNLIHPSQYLILGTAMVLFGLWCWTGVILDIHGKSKSIIGK